MNEMPPTLSVWLRRVVSVCPLEDPQQWLQASPEIPSLASGLPRQGLLKINTKRVFVTCGKLLIN